MTKENDEVNMEADKFDRKRTKIEWIRCKDISVVWATAQRPYNERHAQHIAANFDPDMFDTIKVTMPNGKGMYHIVDGQHRKGAAEILWGPNEMIPCEVLPAENPARAAKLFVEINSNRKPLQPITMFLVRVTAGEDSQVAINKIVKSLGLKIGHKAKDNDVGAVSALEEIYHNFGPDILSLTLKCLQETWGIDPNSVKASLLRGYASFLAEFHHSIELKRLRECISSKYSPGNLLAVAKTYKELHGGTSTRAVKSLLITNYNKRKRAGQIASKEAYDSK